MNMAIRLRRALRSESGDSVTVMLITGMVFILVCLGISVDMSKNAAARQDYTSIAQESTQAAIRLQDGSGNIECGDTSTTTLRGLSQMKSYVSDFSQPASKRLAVQTYLQKTGRLTATARALGSDSNYNRNMRAMASNGASIDADGDRFSMKLFCSSGISSSFGAGKKNALTPGGSSSKLNVISMEVNDWTDNFILGIIGLPMQSYDVTARAIASWNGSAVS